MGKNSYKSGDCDVYAIALGQVLGKPLVVVRNYYEEDGENWYEDCHVAVKVGHDRYRDVEGIKSGEEMIGQCYFNNPIEDVKIESVSEEEAKYLMTVEGVKEQEIDKAKKFILRQVIRKELEEDMSAIAVGLSKPGPLDTFPKEEEFDSFGNYRNDGLYVGYGANQRFAAGPLPRLRAESKKNI